MSKRHFLGGLLSILILSSCGPKDRPVSYSEDKQLLSEEWAPITTLVERNQLPFVSDGVVTTISPNLYVSNIDWFNQQFPVGSTEREIIRVHEQHHALDQEEYIGDATGITRSARITAWISSYVGSKDFRLEVEKRAFKAEIIFKLNNGIRVVPENYAILMSSSTYRGMISFEDALKWVRQTINNELGVQ